MATMGPAKPKHMYSWWWDSHISPKNSKWLQENLTDMDAKVTQMIKLIEEDADSFARRAEMYYKKRPELMKMVEEFYRAYRALAERYDNATGVIRQAHRTMAEAFPNQVPPFQGDESPAASTIEGDPRTPDVSPFRLSHGLDESQKDAARHTSATKRNGTFSQESNTVKRGLKEFDDLLGSGGRVRKGLNFKDEESHQRDENDNGNHVPKGYVESERFSKAELEISALKNALSKLEAEKEASHLQYQQTLEKFSSLESEVSRMTKDSSRVGEQAKKANEEAQHLKDTLAKLETVREDAMVQLQQYEDKISNLEISLSHEQQGAAELHMRAGEAEAAADSLKQETARLEVEKESALLQHEQLMGKVSETEAKLLQAEEDARKAIEQAGKAESEAENLRQMLAKITEEKEAAAVQYLQCLETIAALERKLAVAEEEKQKLKLEMDDRVSKFKDAEEKCLLLERSNQSMHFAMESKSQEMAAQREELTVKQQELGVLWNSLQEERLRFVEAETAFQTLQHLHSQSQDELRSLAAEFQKQKQNLGDLEAYNRRLQNEVEHITGENKGLNEVNLSSAMTIQELQARISQLKDTIRELEAEIELRVDQRNALQQEIYCLKEELNELKKNHQAFIEQVESVGFSPVSFVEDVKNLMDENMKLKEDCERGSGENAALMDKLVVTNVLVEKNILLENSLSDLNVELEGVRDRVKELEKSCESLQGEKSSLSNETSTLVSQLHAANDHLGRASQKNSSLENSLLETRYELEALQVNVKGLQDSCSVLENEKSNLITEKESLILELDISHRKLESLNATFKELEEKHFSLETDRESMLHEVEGLKVCLGAERLAHEKLQVKSRALEDFNDLLQNEKSDLASAKESLVLKLETSERELASLNANCRELVDKHFSLGKEREFMFHELEGLKICLDGERLEHEKLQVKSRSLEDFNLLLQNEKSVLAAAKESLVFKLETSESDLLNLNARYRDLEKKHFSLEKESESMIQEAEGLKVCLGAERLEHEKLQVKSRSLEDCNLLLQNEKSDLAAAKESLVLKLETAERELASLNANYRELEEKHFSLGKERESMLHELEGLKVCLGGERLEHEKLQVKSRSLEDFNLLLQNEKSVLAAAKESLVLKLETSERDLLNLNARYRDLEKKHFSLEKKSESMIQEAEGLKVCLGAERLEHEKLQVKSRSLEDVNLLLQNEKSDLAAAKESLVLKLETAERDLASLNATYRELEEKHFSLVKEREFMLHEADGLKASLAAEKHEHATLARISEAQLALQISEMQEKLRQKSQEFDAELEEATNAQIEIFVMEESIRRCVKKNFELLVEFQKLLEASQQSKKLISELQNEKVEQDTQTRSLSEQLNMLREGLYQVLKALDADQLVDDIEEEDKALLSLIVDKLKASQRVLFGLQDDKQKLVVENSLLLTLVRELQLEVATIVTAKTAVDQQFATKCEQFLLLQASGQKLAETCEELKIKLKEKEQEEAAVKNELRSIQEQLLDLQGAHLNLRDENIKVLDEKRYLMKLVSDLRLEKHDLEEEYLSILAEAIFQGTLSSIFQGFVSESSMALKELSHDVDEAILENGDLKETAILMEGKEAELIQTIEEFRCKLEGLEVIRTDQATQIMKLYGQCGQHRQQADSAHEAIQQLEFELQRLQGNSVEMKRMADMLNNEVQAKAKEIIILESEAEALLGQLQISLFKEALLEGKIYDLADLCSHFEDKNHSSEIEIDQLRERVDIVDAENREIKSRMSTYAASFVALKDAIGELENHATPKRALSEVYGNETKDALVFEVESNLPFAASNSWELQTRIKAIEKAVIEKEKLLMLENSSLNSKLQAAMRQIEEERSPKETLQAVGTYEPVNAYPNGKELGSGRPKYSREIYEEGSEVITKDVMLDQVSESSFHRISRTKKEHSRERLSTDSLGEKEIGIDRLDISKHFSGSRQDSNDKKILERLDSDSGKLTSLELVIQDLKKKVEVAEKNNTKGKGIEYDSVKEQLEESEQAIQRISEMNQKLKKTIEEDPSAFDEKPALTIDQAGLMKRRRISEQARRGSEKVGRLQLEVQKLQYLLAKLDDETKSKVKAKAAEKTTSILLRDFLHGGTRTGPRSKKGRFCSCVRPATTGD